VEFHVPAIGSTIHLQATAHVLSLAWSLQAEARTRSRRVRVPTKRMRSTIGMLCASAWSIAVTTSTTSLSALIAVVITGRDLGTVLTASRYCAPAGARCAAGGW
jgi:hypothetical protein